MHRVVSASRRFLPKADAPLPAIAARRTLRQEVPLAIEPTGRMSTCRCCSLRVNSSGWIDCRSRRGPGRFHPAVPVPALLMSAGPRRTAPRGGGSAYVVTMMNVCRCRLPEAPVKPSSKTSRTRSCSLGHVIAEPPPTAPPRPPGSGGDPGPEAPACADPVPVAWRTPSRRSALRERRQESLRAPRDPG